MALKTWKGDSPEDQKKMNNADRMTREYVSGGSETRKQNDLEWEKARKEAQGTPISMQAQGLQQKNDSRTARERYTESLGKGGTGVRELTTAEFEALTPEQQASVRASTQLYDAIKADRADAAGKGDESYDKLSSQLFGTDNDGEGGSNAFSPRTLAVLNELGLGGDRDDLDNYLDFRALTTDVDLGLNTSVKPAAGRSEQQKGLAEAAAKALEDNAGTGFDLLGQAATDEDGLSEKLRAALGANGPALGYGTEQVDSDLSQLFSLLSQRDNADVNAHWGDWVNGIKTDYGLTDEQIGTYFQNRLRDSSYDTSTETSADGTTVQLGSMGSSSYLTPTEFRQKYFGG